jgi:SAM-dependent methyltransferase
MKTVWNKSKLRQRSGGAGTGKPYRSSAAQQPASQQALVTQQYDEIIAPNYDRDSQGVIGKSLGLALDQLRRHGFLSHRADSLRVYDVGMGTGLFLELLIKAALSRIEPFGLDVSAQMAAHAQARIPGLKAVIADGARLDETFLGEQFELVCTHFLTGFVPLATLAPMVSAKLAAGGQWSYLGGLSEGYPELQRIAEGRIVKWLLGGGKFSLSQLLTPANTDAVVTLLEAEGLEILEASTLELPLQFDTFQQFMRFAYDDGWLTPILQELGVDRLRPAFRAVLDRLAFPVSDRHLVAAVLARKPA